MLSSYAATTFAASKGRLIRCTVLGSTPNRFAIFRTPSVRPGAFRAARIRFSNSGAIRRSPKLLALTLGPPKASANPLLNDGPLELTKHAQHLKHGFAASRRRVDALLVQKQIDANTVNVIQEADQVLQAPAKAIDGPHHDHVELPTRSGFMEGIKGWPLVPSLSARNAVILVNLHNLPTGAICDLP
jgi:hypothetical protein